MQITHTMPILFRHVLQMHLLSCMLPLPVCLLMPSKMWFSVLCWYHFACVNILESHKPTENDVWLGEKNVLTVRLSPS